MPRDSSGIPPDAPRRDGDREEALAALRTRVQALADEIRTADDWERCLRATALLGESFANSLLIFAERPGATLVKGYEDWRKVGRQVIRHETGIGIFSRAPAEPRRRRTSQDFEPLGGQHGWRDAVRVAHVWDVSQTSGQPIAARATLPAAPEGALPGLWDSLCWLARRLGYTVERERGAPPDGVTFWTARRVRVLPDLGTGEASWALAHQLGHVLLHGPPAYPPDVATSSDACLGVRKAEADAVAFITCARHGAAIPDHLGRPQIWAGTDPRAQPGAVILTAGERITAAAARISQHFDRVLHASRLSPARADTAIRSRQPGHHPQAAAAPAARHRELEQSAAPPPRSPSPGVVRRVLADAEQFYVSQLPDSWAPGYLTSRGIGRETITEWQIGYAPAGWTTLTEHLRALEHADHDIEAAGLARRSSRGTLIDHFRDRVMLPVSDEHGDLAGFIGRARPGAGPGVPKYLNTPQTAAYRKGELLFGLRQTRRNLAAGATPVVVEGPFDAIAVSLADPARYAGLAPCGTALTGQQAALLKRTASPDTRIMVAFDDDLAGRKAAVRAYGILRDVSSRLQSVMLVGRDPAQILQEAGTQALRATLGTQLQPLSVVVIDAAITPWEHRLHETDGPLLAMRSAATIIAGLLPAGTAAAIRHITAGKELATIDDEMRPVALPELPEIAATLSADTAYQIARVASRLGIENYSDVLAEVANAVNREAARPKRAAHDRAPWQAASSFPRPPVTERISPEHATTRQRRADNRTQRAQAKG